MGQADGGTPPYLMRWCRSYTDIEGFVDALGAGEELTPEEYTRLGIALAEWQQLVAELPEEARAATLERWASGGAAVAHQLSVYACETRDVLDIGHALGVVAVTLGYMANARDKRKAVMGRKGVTVLLSSALLSEQGTEVPHTEHACNTLCVAASCHHDIILNPTNHLLFLSVCRDALSDASNVHKIGPRADEQPFGTLVNVVLRYCRDGMWALREDGTYHAPVWRQAGSYSVAAQVDSLCELAVLVGFDWAS